MATEIAHEPAAQRQHLDLNSGAEAISGILNQEPAEAAPPPEEARSEPVEAEVEAEAAPSDDEELAPEQEAQAEESVAQSEPKEAKEKPATDEDDAASEIELEPAQVAQMLGLDENDIEVNDDGDIQVHTKINGKPAKASLKDLRRSYELSQTHEERLRELGRERKAFEDESKAVLENLYNQQQQMSYATQALEDDFASNYQAIDWNKLRVENPTEYVAKKQDFEDRKSRIAEYKQYMQGEAQKLQGQYAEQLQKMQSEGARQLEDVFRGESYKTAPSWDQSEMERLSKWIMDQGFSAEDISSVGVWQVFKWARDSMLREAELKQARDAVKKVTKLPKVVKPGKPKAAKEVKQSKIKDLKAKQRKSGGDLKATTELLSNLFKE